MRYLIKKIKFGVNIGANVIPCNAGEGVRRTQERGQSGLHALTTFTLAMTGGLITVKNSSTYQLIHFKKSAFTLAEVLITIGIIGVVAAITFPMLMTKINNYVLARQYKKALSTINQGLKMVYEQTDKIHACYYPVLTENYANEECNELFRELRNVWKVSHVCNSNAYASGCIPKYKGKDTIEKENCTTDCENAGTQVGCRGFDQEKILNGSAIVLMDGTIIGPYNGIFYYPIFYIDINGTKGPNKWGYDVFAMTLYGNETSLYAKAGACTMSDKSGRSNGY
ncbi:type II secretion system protein [bacterium]|nr:type II secretion system protein [bacterium]